ncbi:hypothetical protein AX16_007143 [Volvariella volvacea WC 439]|nr:hypothetical protein AX16_007143 [Volvariella volvacea WC 439]
MAKAESKRGTGTPRGKGTYVDQACTVCRQKKSRCDGTRPVCQACIDDGRAEECAWTGGVARAPRTEAHFEALRKRAEALREYANLLESMLDKCRRDHGGVWEDGESYLQFRPLDFDGAILPDAIPQEEDESTDGNPAQALCVPMQSLQLDDEGALWFYGNTAVFRFAPESSPPSTSRFPDIAEHPEASYTLLVDEVDQTHYNPHLDWARYLPTAVPLDRKSHDRILDLVFRFFTSWCFRVVPALFLRDMWRALSVPKSQTLPKTAHYSPMLHNALIALGSAFSDDPLIRDSRSREYFAQAAKGYLEAECQKPNISAVQALSILASYHSSKGEQTLGYLYFGMSARVCQSLGLEMDCSQWVQAGLIGEHDMLDRNWAYWMTFSQDICWSLYVGRDFCVQPPSQPLPVPFVDTEMDRMPWFYPPAKIPPQPNFLSKTFAAGCQLLMIARRIMNVVNNLSQAKARREVNEELVSMIDLEMNNWKGNLGPELDITIKSRPTSTPHRLVLHLVYWWLFILLHRPFYYQRAQPGKKSIEHVKLCKRGADNIMELLETYRSLYTLRYCPVTLIQTVFSAGTIYLLVAVDATSGSRVAQGSLENSVSQANKCIEHLAEIGQSWQCASHIGDILKDLLRRQLQPILERRSITVRMNGLGRTLPGAKRNVGRRGNRGTVAVGRSPLSAVPPANQTPPSEVTSPRIQRDSSYQPTPPVPPQPANHSVIATTDPPILLPVIQTGQDGQPPAEPATDIVMTPNSEGLPANLDFGALDTVLDLFGADIDMDGWSGTPAMLGGRTISNLPFVSKFTPSTPFRDSTAGAVDNTLHPGVVGPEITPDQFIADLASISADSSNSNDTTVTATTSEAFAMPESDFAFLEQFWEQHFARV